MCVRGAICASFPLRMCLDSQVTQDAVTWKLNLNLSATFSPGSPRLPPRPPISSCSPLLLQHLSDHLSGNDLCPFGYLQSPIDRWVYCVLYVRAKLCDRVAWTPSQPHAHTHSNSSLYFGCCLCQKWFRVMRQEVAMLLMGRSLNKGKHPGGHKQRATEDYWLGTKCTH